MHKVRSSLLCICVFVYLCAYLCWCGPVKFFLLKHGCVLVPMICSMFSLLLYSNLCGSHVDMFHTRSVLTHFASSQLRHGTLDASSGQRSLLRRQFCGSLKGRVLSAHLTLADACKLYWIGIHKKMYLSDERC